MVLVSSINLGRIFTGGIYLQVFGTKCCINVLPLSCVPLVSPIPFLSLVLYNTI